VAFVGCGMGMSVHEPSEIGHVDLLLARHQPPPAALGMGRFCGVFYRVAQITLFLPPQFIRCTRIPRVGHEAGHGAMNVYENNGRRLNTRRATDSDPEISALPIDSKFLPRRTESIGEKIIPRCITRVALLRTKHPAKYRIRTVWINTML
jgi:hypothetical protein